MNPIGGYIETAMTVFGGLVLLVVVAIAIVWNQKQSRKAVVGTSSAGPVPDTHPLRLLALALGWSHQGLPRPSGPEWNGLQSWDAHRLEGVHGGVPIQGSFCSYTKMRATGFEYLSDNRITLSSAKVGSFRIEPRKPNLASQPTGNATFDAKLALSGDAALLRDEQLEALGSLGWMNLKLANGELTFCDTYFDDLRAQAGSFGAAAALQQAVHPVWGQSASQPNINLEQARRFFDLLVDIAQRA